MTTEEVKTANKARNHPAFKSEVPPMLDQPSKWSLFVQILLLTLMIAGDAVNLKQVVDIAFRANMFTSITLTAAITGAAVLIMELAGRSASKVRLGLSNFRYSRVLALMIPWAALGIVAFVIRLNAEPSVALLGTSLEQSANDAFEGVASEAGSSSLLAALLMLALYIASGVVAYHLGFITHRPRTHLLKQFRQRVLEAEAQLEAAAGVVRTKQHEFTYLTNVIQSAAEIREAELAQLEAKASHFKERARLVISSRLGEPAKTSGVTRELKA